MDRNLTHIKDNVGNCSVKYSVPETDHVPLNDLNDTGERRSSSESNNFDGNVPMSLRKDSILHTLSGIYAEILIVIAMTSVLAEILPKSLPLFYFHDYVYIYLLGGGLLIFTISFSLKIYELFSQSPQDLQSASQKRAINAYISSPLKTGSLVFGASVIVTTVLEILSIFTSPHSCLSFLSASQPLLRCLFVLFQLYFILDSKVLIFLGCVQNLALMHLFATNLAIWIQTLLWESAKDWESTSHIKLNSSVALGKLAHNFSVHVLEFDTNSSNANKLYQNHVVRYTSPSKCYWQVQKSENVDVTSVQYCLQNSTIGALWEKMDSLFYTFKTQYYLIMGCILYMLWIQCKSKFKKRQYRLTSCNNALNGAIFSRSTKGFFLGTVILVASIIMLIVFFSVDKDFHMTLNVMFCVIFILSAFSSLVGITQVTKMYSWKSTKEIRFVKVIQHMGLLAVLLYASSDVIVSTVSQNKHEFIIVIKSITMIIHTTTHYLFIVLVSKKKVDASNVDEKPGRQVVMFLVFCNVSLWILECFVLLNHFHYQYQLSFFFNFGTFFWSVITRSAVPIVVFYRYHSAATLLSIWSKTYNQNVT